MQRFRKHINPATVLALVALVFAVTGGAYAAGGASGSRATAQVAKAKGKKKSSGSSGKPGPRGPQGPVGPVGPVGATGATGAAGAKGESGASGSNGRDGESVNVGEASSAECAAGGAKFSNGTGSGKVCNGKNGANGATPEVEEFSGVEGGCAEGGVKVAVTGKAPVYVCNGKAGSAASGTLQAGESENGMWGTAVPTESAGFAAITLPKPFASAPTVEFILPGKANTHCKGDGEAAAGYLCVYAVQAVPSLTENETDFYEFSYVENTSNVEAKAGVAIEFINETTGSAFAAGSWTATG